MFLHHHRNPDQGGAAGQAEALSIGAILIRGTHWRGRTRSTDALKLLETASSEDLASAWRLETKCSYTTCSLEEGIPHTVGTQCLINLYDPGNGWTRDATKRVDLLEMTAKLCDKGVSLEGLTYYKGSFCEKSVISTIQGLLDDPHRWRPLNLSPEILEMFEKNGYKFDYSKTELASYALEVRDLDQADSDYEAVEIAHERNPAP